MHASTNKYGTNFGSVAPSSEELKAKIIRNLKSLETSLDSRVTHQRFKDEVPHCLRHLLHDIKQSVERVRKKLNHQQAQTITNITTKVANVIAMYIADLDNLISRNLGNSREYRGKTLAVVTPVEQPVQVHWGGRRGERGGGGGFGVPF